MISSRHTVLVAALVAIALIPTAIHSYWGVVVVDTLTTAGIPKVLDGMRSTPTERRAAWVENTLASTDWIERVYRVAGENVLMFVGRSYDPKRLYHHPELALLRGTNTAGAGVMRAASRPDVPLHVLTTERSGSRGVAVYALLYDGSFVENPIAFQLSTSAALLVTGRKPMTLFLASDLSGTPSDIDAAPATRLLLAALRSFEAQTTTRLTTTQTR